MSFRQLRLFLQPFDLRFIGLVIKGKLFFSCFFNFQQLFSIYEDTMPIYRDNHISAMSIRAIERMTLGKLVLVKANDLGLII